MTSWTDDTPHCVECGNPFADNDRPLYCDEIYSREYHCDDCARSYLIDAVDEIFGALSAIYDIDAALASKGAWAL